MGDEPSAPDLRDLKPFAAVLGFFHSDRHVWKGPPPLYMQMWMQSFSFPIDGMASRATHKNLSLIASPPQAALHHSFSGGPGVFHHHTRQAEAVSHRQHIL